MRNWMILMLVLGLASCGGQEKAPEKAATTGESPAVAKVGDRTITEADIDAEFAAMPEQYRAMRENPAMRANLLNSMLDRYALTAKAEKMGIDKDPEVRHRIEMDKMAILMQEMDRRHQKEATKPDEKAIEAYYEANKQRFDLPERVQVRQILVKDEAEAKKLLAQLKKGADFAALAKKYSIDRGSSGRGGELPVFSAGMMESSFSKAAFGLRKEGELAGPVKSPFGYHIIQLIKHLPAGQQSLAEVRPQIEMEMQQRSHQEWIRSLRSDAGVQILNPAYAMGKDAGGKK